MAFSPLLNLEVLATRDIVTAGTQRTSLGVRCHGELGTVAPEPERDALLATRAPQWLLDLWRWYASHCQSRDVSMSSTAAQSVGAPPPVQVWRTFHHELRLLRGLLRSGQAVLRLNTWRTILAVDACPSGSGVVVARGSSAAEARASGTNAGCSGRQISPRLIRGSVPSQS